MFLLARCAPSTKKPVKMPAIAADHEPVPELRDKVLSHTLTTKSESNLELTESGGLKNLEPSFVITDLKLINTA